VLASSSPRRRELLSRVGISFEVIPSELEEDISGYPNAVAAAEGLARDKACSVGAAYPSHYVLAADTLVFVGEGADEQVLGKPADSAEATEMLSLLQGREHSVVTGVSLFSESRDFQFVFSVLTKVWFRAISQAEIAAYVLTGESRDKAGAYALQAIAGMFIERIEGSVTNVIGLPMAEVIRELAARELWQPSMLND
jgi:septum formation protein